MSTYNDARTIHGDEIEQAIDTFIELVLQDSHVKHTSDGGMPVTPETWFACKAKLLALLTIVLEEEENRRSKYHMYDIAERMNSYIRATQDNSGIHRPKVTLTLDGIVYYTQEVRVERENVFILDIWDTSTHSSWLSLPVESPVFQRLMRVVGIPGWLQKQVIG